MDAPVPRSFGARQAAQSGVSARAGFPRWQVYGGRWEILMKPLLLIWVLVLLLAGCEHTQTKSQIVEDLGGTDEANAQRSREILYATLWMQHSAEYRAAAL